VTADLHFFAGLATVRLLVTLTNPNRARHRGGFWDLGDEGSALIEDASITIARAASDTHGIVRASIEPGAPLTQVATPFEVYQDSSGGENWQSTVHLNREHRIPTSFRGYRIRAGAETTSGLRATPVVAVESGTTLLAATLPHFWQNFPKAIESDGGSLVIRLFPAQYADLHELQGGEQRTHELYLAFGPDRLSADGLEWCRSRTIAGVEPAWCLSSEAVPFLAPLDAGHAELVESAIEGADRFEHKREVIDEYGWRHFGDIYGDHEAVPHDRPTPLVSHYNNQYDPIAGFACQWLRTGDPRWWIAMSELASHVIDIDVYHTVEDKAAYNHGLFWHTYHYGDADTATHRSYPRSGLGHVHGGGPSAGHNYTSGLALHYFLTGERASRGTVRDLAQYVIDIDDGRKAVFRWLDRGATGLAALSVDGYYGPGRGPANSLNALTDCYRLTGDRRFARKAEELIRRVIHPQDDISQRQLDEPELRWFYTMFLQALGRWLREKVERGEVDEIYAYGRESLLHYARWMAVHEYPYLDKPEKLEFPTETWAAQDIRKSDVFLLAALHASGEERQRFIDRGRFFHQHSIQALEGKPTRTLARPVVVLLTSGIVRAWVEARPDAAEPDPPRVASFGVPQAFVPQRARAIRRFVWLSAAGFAALAAAALYALL
jgi:hypothetical protein